MENAIKDFVSKNGVNLLSDTEQLKTFLIEKSVDSEDIEKLIYFLDNGNLLDYIARIEKSNISSAELNNIIVGSYKATGLQITLIKKLTSIVLSAMSVNYEYQTLECYDSDKEIFVEKETSFLSYDNIKDALGKAQMLRNFNKTDEAIKIYLTLANAGVSDAMYELGMCYLNEMDNSPNNTNYSGYREQIAKQWFGKAASLGNYKARILLGDNYYNQSIYPDLQKALSMYSAPGVVTVKPTIKDKIINIINQGKSNIATLVISGIMLILMWLSLFFEPFNHHMTMGIIINIFTTIIYGGSIFYNCLFKYNMVKPIIFPMYLIWTVYPFIISFTL